MKLATLLNTAVAFLFFVGHVFGAADLVPTKLQLAASITNSPLPAVTIKWTVTNQGDAPAGGFWDGVYISTNSILDNAIPAVTTWYINNSVAPGQSYSRTAVVQLPIGYSGSYYLIFKTDIYNTIPEADYGNNIIVSPLSFQAVSSDLAVQTVLLPTDLTVPPNPYLTLIFSVTNLGPGATSGNWFDNITLSAEASDPIFIGAFMFNATVLPGQVYWQTNQVRLPVLTSGNYSLTFNADAFNSLFELNLSNNTLSVPIHFTVQAPDLAALPLQCATELTSAANPVMQAIWGVTNTGPVVAQGYWNDVVYLSTNEVLDEQSDQIMTSSYESGPVLPGASYFRTNSLQLFVRQSGTYYLFFKTDAYDGLSELTLSNNVTSRAINLTIQRPDFVPLSFQVPLVITSPPNPVLKLSWEVSNQGDDVNNLYWSDQLYLSRSPFLDSSATRLQNFFESGTIDKGENYRRTNQVQIPVTQNGTYYLIFYTDDSNSLNESDTDNNTIIQPITFTIVPPNLKPVALQVPSPITSTPNPTVQIVWGITNRGSGTAVGNWFDRLYFSTDSQLDQSDLQELIVFEAGPIPAGGSYWRTNSIQLPVTQSGTYYLILAANNDSNSKIIESDYSDNVQVAPITFTIQPPDLAPILSRLPIKITGPPFPSATVVWGITNQGPGAAKDNFWTDALYLSPDPAWDFSDSPLASYSYFGPVSSGGVVWFTNTVVLPVITSGTNYFIVQANAGKNLVESDYNNNVGATPITIEIHPPDLTPLALQAPNLINGPPYPSMNIVWGVTNQGTGDAIGHYAWYDHLFVSTNATLDATALDVFSTAEQGPVEPGETYWRTNAVRLPITSSGSYHLFFKGNFLKDLVESDYGNNAAGVSFTFNMQPPDLEPVGIQVPASIVGPPYPSLTYVWGITNLGAGAAQPYPSFWFDTVRLSTNDFWDPSATQVETDYADTVVPAGAVYWHTNTIRLLITQSGTYYLIFNADESQTLPESDYDNNVVSRPVQITIQPPDLAPLGLQLPNSLTCPPNPTISVIWAVTNQGPGSAVGFNNWDDRLYFSDSPVWSPQNQVLASGYEYNPVAAGQTYRRTNLVQLPVTRTGTYYLTFRVDDSNALLESDEANNVVSVPITINVLPPDLAPVIPASPIIINGSPNPSFTLTWGVTNQGTGTAIAPWNDTVYFSRKPRLDFPGVTQLYVNFENTPIEAGGVIWLTNSVWAPVSTSGNYYLIFDANTGAEASLYETDYSNNLVIVPVTFAIQHPDLAPIALLVPPEITTTPNPTITFVWGITNHGPGAAASPYPYPIASDDLFISTNAIFDDTAQMLFSADTPNPVPAGTVYWRTNSVTVPITTSGTYFFTLQADAQGSLFESDYLNNAITVPVNFTILPPDLAPVALLTSSVITSTPNPVISIVWGVTNQGSGEAKGFWTDALYLATNNTPDSIVANISWPSENGPIMPGSTYWRTNTFSLPVLQSGQYYILFKVNDFHGLFESNFDNNTLWQHLTFTILPPDLAPIALKAPSLVTAPPNPSIQLEWGVTNQGPGAAVLHNDAWIDRLYLSSTPDGANGMTWLGINQYERGSVESGGQYWRSQWVQIPVTEDGTYYLIFQADADHRLYESDDNNNSISVPITFKIQKSDLVPLALRAPSVVNSSANPSIKFTWGVTNQGIGAAISAWQDSFYLSTDAVLDSSDVLTATHFEPGPLAAGGSYWRSQTLQLAVQTNGDYFVILQTGSGNLYRDENPNNNTIAVPIRFNLPPPDLEPISFQAPTDITAAANPTVTLVWGITNRGPGSAVNQSYTLSWYDQVFFSTNATVDIENDPIILRDFSTPSSLAPGEVYWRTNLVRLPVANDGTYYLHFQANVDRYRPLYESDYQNNGATTMIRVHVSAPDFAPISLQGPATVSGARMQPISFVWGLTNLGPGAASGGWGDYFSLEKINPSDGSSTVVNVWTVFQTSQVNAGESYWNTNTVLFPAIESGAYRLKLTADAYNDLQEVSITNNTTSIPIAVAVIPPDIEAIFFSGPSIVTGPAYPLVTMVWGVTNQSPSTAAPISYPWFDRVYISTNAFLDEAAIFVGEWWQTNSIAAHGAFWFTNTLQLPVVNSGNYFLILDLDVFHTLYEDNTTNNLVSFPLTVNLLPPPDLRPLSFQAPNTINGPANPVVTLVWGVTNAGLGTAQSKNTWHDTIFVSDAPPPSGVNIGIISGLESAPIPPGGVYWRTSTIVIPVIASGDYFIVFTTDAGQDMLESDYANNTVIVPVTVNVSPPDLAVLSLQAPAQISGAPNPATTIVAGITNLGPGTALPGSDALYVSATPYVDSSARVTAYLQRTNAIPPGGVYWFTNSLRLPVVDSGNYYLLYQADLDNVLWEFNFLNNLAFVPMRFDLSLEADLALHEFQYPHHVAGGPNPRVQLVWHVVNEGLGPAVGPWSDSIWYQTNYNSSGGLLARFSSSDVLPVGMGSWRTNRVILPVDRSGQYSFSLGINSVNDIPELDYANNSQYFSIDVLVTNVAPVGIVAGQFLPDGAFQIGVSAAKGAIYTLESSTNLVDWSRVMDFVCTNALTWLADPPSSRYAQRFYRVAPYIGAEATPLILGFGKPHTSVSNGIELILDGPLSVGYRIQTSTNFLDWNTIATFPSLQTSPLNFVDPSTTLETPRFYRAISP